MTKCIYCGKAREFNREHVIPKFLGNFEPVNPIIDNLVCNVCNSNKFSKLETEFKEDSQEGILSQQFNLSNSNSIRIRGKNVKLKSKSPFDDSFFDDTFPFLKEENNEPVVDFKSQIKIKNYANGYQIFTPEALRNIKKSPSKFKKTKERLKCVKGTNIRIFTGGNSAEEGGDLDEIIKLLKEFGVKYNEGGRKFSPIEPTKGKGFEVNMDCTITVEICRVLAKIIFNYFIYCCIQEKKEKLLFENNFNQIKSFIAGDKNIKREDVIVSHREDVILYDEKVNNKRYAGHIIIFYSEGDKIYGKITILGCKIYKILIGTIPISWKIDSFGCGHLFYPFDNSIHNLTQEPQSNPTPEQIKTSFGLFKRI